MSEAIPPWAKRVTINENVVYVGEDGWKPDPVELIKALARSEMLVRSEMIKANKEKTGQDLNN